MAFYAITSSRPTSRAVRGVFQTTLCVLAGLFLLATRPDSVLAQPGKVYELIRVDTSADDPASARSHQIFQWQRKPDGSVLGTLRPHTTEEAIIQVWPAECRGTYQVKVRDTLHSSGEYSWEAPPKRWAQGATADLGARLHVTRHPPVNSLSAAFMQFVYVQSPTGLLEAVGESRPPGLNPLQHGGRGSLVAYTDKKEAGSASAEGRITARLEFFAERFTITVLPKCWRGAGIGVNYHYQQTSTGQPASGLYLEAGKEVVLRGEKVSVPIYLRYRGNQTPPTIANMNFEVAYQSAVAEVRPHPNPARKPSGTKETLEPELPRGNLLSGSTMIAGNTQPSNVVLVGFAGKAGVEPGVGRPGETVTEIYYQAVGNPGDETPLVLKVTTSMDAEGHDIPIETVDGSIRIYRPPSPTTSGLGTGPGESMPGQEKLPEEEPEATDPNQWEALDAYIALLMSVQRRPSETKYDVDTDASVTSTDSAIILRKAIKVPVP